MMFSIGIMMGSQELLMENLCLVKQRRSVNMSNFSPLTFAAAVSVSGSGGGGGSGTSNYEALSNLPKINGVTLAGSKTSSDLKITSITSYTELSNTPSINGVALTGDKTTSDLKISGVTSYTERSNTPSINGVSLSGNKSSADLKITSITSYTDLSDKPSIAGVTLSGNKMLSELGIAGKDDIPALADSISGGVYGDILYQKAAGSTSKLSIGKNGQIITVSDNKLCRADIPDAVPKEGSMVVQ